MINFNFISKLATSFEKLLSKLLLSLVFGVVMLSHSQLAAQTNYCTTGCNDNTFLNSVDPNTIEYDNIVSVFHSSMVKEADGKVKVWGQGIAFNGTGITGNVLAPQVMNSSTYPGLTGNILKFTGGSNSNEQQFAVLTTTGLFIWGGPAGTLVTTAIKADNIFGKVSVATFGVTGTNLQGLPAGVVPTDVKMMFGSQNTLAIVTCTGQAWVLSSLPTGEKYGDGEALSTANNNVWHRVKTSATTNLDKVVAVRGTLNALMALTSDGEIYTWGIRTHLGDNTGRLARPYATLMVKPTGITPKMIGMTQSSLTNVTYYLLGTNGQLYSLGDNAFRQLGIFSTTSSNVWVRVQKSATAGDYLNNIAWISPQEHEGQLYAAINALTSDGKLWAWGYNNAGMLGGPLTSNEIDPTYMPGSIAAGPVQPGKLNKTDFLLAVETGGHTTITVKKCSEKFGYVGHRIRGSMGNGSTDNGQETEYNFSETAVLNLCGAPTAPTVKDLKICPGATANLAAAHLSIPFAGTTLEWYTSNTIIPSNKVPNPAVVGVGTYYAFYVGGVNACPNPAPSTPVVVSLYLPIDPEYATCTSFCLSGCNDNTYVNSINPNTIEYDNMVGVFHSSMVKESDGKILVWGQGAAFNGTGSTGNVLTPQEVNSSNYPGLSGNILKFAAGSNVNQQQFAVLTTTGLFVWGGSTGSLISPTIKPTVTFGAVAVGTFGVVGTKADGLPDGVVPTDVKMMFGTRNTLAIVTCTGQAWILSTSGTKYGDGAAVTTANSAVWHRVKTDAATNLANVVAVRGTVDAMMALTSDGNIYTWGTGTYIGAGAAANRTYATLMVKPAGITPKMIGMTRSNAGVSYYLLATNGNLYSLGKNEGRQLGNFTTTDSDVWIRVQQSATGGDFLADVAWISPQEHEGGNYAAINILTKAGKLWAWGNSNNSMLGAGAGIVNPTYMPGKTAGPFNAGKLNTTDTLIAVETGGHTTLVIKQCSSKFGYVGHRIRGSMADGTSGDFTETEYNFSDTASLSICGALAGPVVTDLKICAGTFANLTNAEPSSFPPGATSIQWWTTSTRDPGTQVTNTSAVAPGTYYAFYDPLIVTCFSMITVSNYLATDPGYATCVCYDDPAAGTGVATNHGITLLQRAGADNGNWPMIRNSAHTVLESNTKGFVITRMTTGQIDLIANPQDGMMVYDTDGKCLKIYTVEVLPAVSGWKCYVTPACP